MIVDLKTPKIRVLPADVVSRIAAGEIVERPAAVVKELIENSLDAGSSSITVDVSDGGRTMIKVIDDGEGISPADVPLAFERHATSKLQTEQDLQSIQTLGFRGEALASIAAVSRVTLLTARRGDTTGTLFEIAAGVPTKCEEAASPRGTQIEISDLFFNTPARKKFLKTTGTEFSHVCQVVQQAALAWPHVHFRLRHNGQMIADYPAVGSGRDRMLQVYGERWLDQMQPVDGGSEGLRVHGLVVQATHARTSRSPQELFINHRPVRNPTVSHAVVDAYGGTIQKGAYPLFVLFLEADPTRVDVNVHPTKREVRFADPELVHQTVRRIVRAALGGGHAATLTGPEDSRAPFPWQPSTSASSTVDPRVKDGGSFRESASSPGELFLTTPDRVQEPSPSYLVRPPVDVIPLGQISSTFLVAQVGSELQVVDQHTAHERVLFERLRRTLSEERPIIQGLLIPQSLDLAPDAAVLLNQVLPDLARLGFDVEPFGPTSFVVRAVPAILTGGDVARLVEGLLDDLADYRSTASFDERVHPILASLACHSAVRAGRPMTSPEIKTLIEDWVAQGSPTTCPHGRRTVLRLPVNELERIFGR